MENLSILKSEILGVDNFDQILEGCDPEEYETLDELRLYLTETLRYKIKSHGLVEAINIYIDRKMEKVAQYVT
jgi:hypothetical protein